MGRLNSVYIGLPQPCSTVFGWRVCWACVHCYRRQLWACAEGPVTVEHVSGLESTDDSTSSVASALWFPSTPTQLLSSNRESVLSPALPPVGWKMLGKMLRTHLLIWKMRNGEGGLLARPILRVHRLRIDSAVLHIREGLKNKEASCRLHHCSSPNQPWNLRRRETTASAGPVSMLSSASGPQL